MGMLQAVVKIAGKFKNVMDFVINFKINFKMLSNAVQTDRRN
jgi:hypothetical protein